jgi:O-antigen/teichoic acid export membrane protein
VAPLEPGIDVSGLSLRQVGDLRGGPNLWRRRSELGVALRRDSLVRNSAFIMATTVVNSVLGFVFWVVAARLFSAPAIGLAAAVVSSFWLAAVLANPAVHSAYTQVLPRTASGREWSVVVNGGLLLGTVSGVVWGIALVPLLPLVARHMAHLDLLARVGLVAGVVASALSIIVDYLFVAERQSQHMLWRNVAFGVVRLPLLGAGLVFAGGDSATAIWAVWVVSLFLTVAIAVAVGFPRLRRGYRLVFSGALHRWRGIVADVAWHHLANLGALVPMYVLPLFVVARISERADAYFYVTWMLCSLFFIVSPAISQSLFAEGSHDPASVRAGARRSLRITGGLLLAMGVGYLAFGRFVLGIFGTTYAAQGWALLVVLVASAFFDAVTNVYVSVLRVERRLAHAAALNLSMATLSLVLAWVLLPPMGIVGAGVAWLVAQAAGTAWTAVSLILFDRRRAWPVRAPVEADLLRRPTAGP